MMKPTKVAVLFNGAALLLVAAAGIAIFRSAFSPEQLAPCSTRYGHSTRLSLEHAPGGLISTADLQARLGGSDWGLLENAHVVAAIDSPTGTALQVTLQKASAQSATTAPRSGSVGFTWVPSLMGDVQSACLAYAVYMPPAFDFGKGGRLPGLMGSPNDAGGGKPVFSTRYAWTDTAGLEVYGQMPDWPEGRPIPNSRNGFRLAAGRWTALEQEIVLNTPGQKNGSLRIWANGSLEFEAGGLAFRDSPGTRITGVLAEVAANAPDKGDGQKLLVSPLELSW